MKKLVLLLGVGLLLGGCAGERNLGADEPLPTVTEDIPPLTVEEPEPQVTAPDTTATVSGQPQPWTKPAPAKVDTSKPQYPVAKPVPGKPGVVISPYAPYAGAVNVSEYSSGKQVKCPFTGKIFIVP